MIQRGRHLIWWYMDPPPGGLNDRFTSQTTSDLVLDLDRNRKFSA
jgi:hypothetical protein